MLCLLRLLKKNLFKKLRINKIYISDNIIEQIHFIKMEYKNYDLSEYFFTHRFLLLFKMQMFQSQAITNVSGCPCYR